jgi:hypothetical protein
MAYTKTPKFVFFIYKAGSLSLGQNRSVISASSLRLSQFPVTTLISTHINAVRIITNFSYKAHLTFICSRLQLSFTDGFYTIVGRVATGYGLDGPGIQTWWGRDFLHLCTPALGPIQSPVMGVPGLSLE